MSIARVSVALALAGGLLAGCAGEDFSGEAAARLQQEVAEVRAAAAAGNEGDARSHLEELRRLVDEFVGRGDISEARAAEIREAAAAVEAQLAALEPEPTPTPAEPATEEDDDDEGKDEGEGEDEDGEPTETETETETETPTATETETGDQSGSHGSGEEETETPTPPPSET